MPITTTASAGRAGVLFPWMNVCKPSTAISTTNTNKATTAITAGTDNVTDAPTKAIHPPQVEGRLPAPVVAVTAVTVAAHASDVAVVAAVKAETFSLLHTPRSLVETTPQTLAAPRAGPLGLKPSTKDETTAVIDTTPTPKATLPPESAAPEAAIAQKEAAPKPTAAPVAALATHNGRRVPSSHLSHIEAYRCDAATATETTTAFAVPPPNHNHNHSSQSQSQPMRMSVLPTSFARGLRPSGPHPARAKSIAAFPIPATVVKTPSCVVPTTAAAAVVSDACVHHQGVPSVRRQRAFPPLSPAQRDGNSGITTSSVVGLDACVDSRAAPGALPTVQAPTVVSPHHVLRPLAATGLPTISITFGEAPSAAATNVAGRDRLERCTGDETPSSTPKSATTATASNAFQQHLSTDMLSLPLWCSRDRACVSAFTHECALVAVAATTSQAEDDEGRQEEGAFRPPSHVAAYRPVQHDAFSRTHSTTIEVFAEPVARVLSRACGVHVQYFDTSYAAAASAAAAEGLRWSVQGTMTRYEYDCHTTRLCVEGQCQPEDLIAVKDSTAISLPETPKAAQGAAAPNKNTTNTMTTPTLVELPAEQMPPPTAPIAAITTTTASPPKTPDSPAVALPIVTLVMDGHRNHNHRNNNNNNNNNTSNTRTSTSPAGAARPAAAAATAEATTNTESASTIASISTDTEATTIAVAEAALQKPSSCTVPEHTQPQPQPQPQLVAATEAPIENPPKQHLKQPPHQKPLAIESAAIETTSACPRSGGGGGSGSDSVGCGVKVTLASTLVGAQCNNTAVPALPPQHPATSSRGHAYPPTVQSLATPAVSRPSSPLPQPLLCHASRSSSPVRAVPRIHACPRPTAAASSTPPTGSTSGIATAPNIFRPAGTTTAVAAPTARRPPPASLFDDEIPLEEMVAGRRPWGLAHAHYISATCQKPLQCVTNPSTPTALGEMGIDMGACMIPDTPVSYLSSTGTPADITPTPPAAGPGPYSSSPFPASSGFGTPVAACLSPVTVEAPSLRRSPQTILASLAPFCVGNNGGGFGGRLPALPATPTAQVAPAADFTIADAKEAYRRSKAVYARYRSTLSSHHHHQQQPPQQQQQQQQQAAILDVMDQGQTGVGVDRLPAAVPSARRVILPFYTYRADQSGRRQGEVTLVVSGDGRGRAIAAPEDVAVAEAQGEQRESPREMPATIDGGEGSGPPPPTPTPRSAQPATTTTTATTVNTSKASLTSSKKVTTKPLAKATAKAPAGTLPATCAAPAPRRVPRPVRDDDDALLEHCMQAAEAARREGVQPAARPRQAPHPRGAIQHERSAAALREVLVRKRQPATAAPLPTHASMHTAAEGDGDGSPFVANVGGTTVEEDTSRGAFDAPTAAAARHLISAFGPALVPPPSPPPPLVESAALLPSAVTAPATTGACFCSTKPPQEAEEQQQQRVPLLQGLLLGMDDTAMLTTTTTGPDQEQPQTRVVVEDEGRGPRPPARVTTHDRWLGAWCPRAEDGAKAQRQPDVASSIGADSVADLLVFVGGPRCTTGGLHDGSGVALSAEAIAHDILRFKLAPNTAQ